MEPVQLGVLGILHPREFGIPQYIVQLVRVRVGFRLKETLWRGFQVPRISYNTGTHWGVKNSVKLYRSVCMVKIKCGNGGL